MNIVLWVVAVLLALAFLMAGTMHALRYGGPGSSCRG